MACGLTKNAWQLGIARVGVGAGEAAIVPAAWSLLADSFPQEKRAIPVNIYLAGPYLGQGLALILGALILGGIPLVTHIGNLEFANWQVVFIVIAPRGLLLAVIFLIVKEPKRQLVETENVEKRSVSDFVTYVKSHSRVYTGMWLGLGLYVVLLYGIQSWTTIYLIPVHGWDIADAGIRYGILVIIVGTISVLSAPLFHRWLLNKTGKDHALTISAACALLIVPFGLMLPFANAYTVIPIIAASSFLITVPLPLTTTTLQLITPNFSWACYGCHCDRDQCSGLGIGADHDRCSDGLRVQGSGTGGIFHGRRSCVFRADRCRLLLDRCEDACTHVAEPREYPPIADYGVTLLLRGIPAIHDEF